MNKNELISILEKMSTLRIAIIGDFCLDVYWQLNDKSNEISVETLKPIQKVASQKCSLGGAGNLAKNIKALGVQNISAFGLIGNDFFGYEMKRQLSELDINHSGLLIQEKNYLTNVYIKPITHGNELNRFDLGCDNIPENSKVDKMINLINQNLEHFDAIVINQQIINGIHTSQFRKKMTTVLKKYKGKTFLDSRNYPLDYGEVIRKLNGFELLSLSNSELPPNAIITLDKIENNAQLFLKQFSTPTIITRGAESTIIYDKGLITQILGVITEGPIDTVGAGDSFLSGFLAGYLISNDLKLAVQMGQNVAAITIKKLGETGVATPDELIRNHSELKRKTIE